MMIRRRCVQCLDFGDVDSTDKNQTCPNCRSRIGRAKQKSIQKAVRKKRKAAKV